MISPHVLLAISGEESGFGSLFFPFADSPQPRYGPALIRFTSPHRFPRLTTPELRHVDLSFYLSLAAAVCGGLLAVAVGVVARRSPVRWTFVWGLLAIGGECACDAAALATAPDGLVAWKIRSLLFASLAPGAWLMFSLTYARGNTGEYVRSWKYVLGAAVLLPIATVAVAREGLVRGFGQNPADGAWIIALSSAGTVLQVLLLTGALLALMNLERTYRAAVGASRWRIKFMLLGVAAILSVRAYASTQAILFHSLTGAWAGVTAAGLLIGALLVVPSLFRSAFLAIDLYPSRAVLQNSFTILIAGAYLLLVGVCAKIVAALGGSASFQLQAFVVLISLVGLAVFLQSDHARLRARQFVSRHFLRPQHDYREVWKTIAEGTTSCLDQNELSRSLARLVSSLFDCLSVTIWLVDARNETVTFAASTFLSDGQGRQLDPAPKEELSALIQDLQRKPEPRLLSRAPADNLAALSHSATGEFPGGRFDLCLPLVCQGELLGLLLLGDRVGRRLFTTEDLDVLKCVADHAAANLRNTRLSQKLLQAKELEAFQTMATFFVHDLKNAASTLSLMLQNLPVHYDDPRFREDALRGIGKTVAHVNHLIGRLGQLRHELSIQPGEADFNQMVSRAVTCCAARPDIEVVTDFGAVPKLRFDSEQMTKVVTNLVLNATEAISDNGSIRIATAQKNGWAVLSVADNGCGMNAEFVDRSLFRPFQTTKKHGLGVGMFQSKMIVEAHGGRLAVQSEPGRGTTFQVFIPVGTALP